MPVSFNVKPIPQKINIKYKISLQRHNVLYLQVCLKFLKYVIKINDSGRTKKERGDNWRRTLRNLNLEFVTKEKFGIPR